MSATRGARLAARTMSIAAATWALVATLVGGAIAPGYSHSSQYISELGERGTTLGAVVSVAGFLPIGFAALAALILTARSDVARSIFGASVTWMFTLPLSYIVAAFARCTAGCSGVDATQAAHNLAGMAEYLGGVIALAIAGTRLARHRRIPLGITAWLGAVCVLICFCVMASPQWQGVRGAAQRIAEAVLFGFLILLGWHADRESRD